MPNIYSFKTCINCGLSKRTNGQKYCSSSCQQKYQYKEYISRWLSGEESGMRGTSDTSTMIKKYLIETRGRRCEICHNTRWLEHEIPISLHHIDGLFSNNRPENLQLLCPNCHTFTPNFGKKNKSGRPRYFKKESS